LIINILSSTHFSQTNYKGCFPGWVEVGVTNQIILIFYKTPSAGYNQCNPIIKEPTCCPYPCLNRKMKIDETHFFG
jgi:hypothetical protein